MNPYLFGKGEWQDIARIRMQVTYDGEGKTFLSVVEHSEDVERRPQTPPQTTQATSTDSDELPGQMSIEDYYDTVPAPAV